MASPATLVLGSRTVRAMTVSNTRSSRSALHPGHHFAGVDGAGVEPGHQDAVDRGVGLSRSRTLSTVSVSKARPRSEKNSQPGGDDHRIRAGERVDGEQTQRRLAVDEHVVVLVEQYAAARGQFARGRPR